jgi:BirA family biotin operon repressor/biotin-[acetyl-CoA-carboxylase] ligase
VDRLLDAASLEAAVRDAGIDVPPRFLESTGSTNSDIVGMAAAGAAEWTVVAATEQTSGRGRLGRSWGAPPGTSLAMSVLVRPTMDAPDVPVLALAAGAAMAEACRQVTTIDVRCKWPNDLVVGGRKVGGILCEAAVQGGRPLHVAVGIGVNVRQRPSDFPPELRDTATSLAIEGTEVAGAPLVAGFLATFRDLVNHPRDRMRTDVLARYRPLCASIGRWVRATTTSGASVDGEAVGVSESGDLLVRAGDLVERVGFGEVEHVR